MRIQCMSYLAPTNEILLRYKEDHDEESYAKTYREQILGNLDVDKVAEYLQGRILLCYERPEAFCHRHIVAKWLNDNGYDCTEIIFLSNEGSKLTNAVYGKEESKWNQLFHHYGFI